jgi:hypothetical protein
MSLVRNGRTIVFLLPYALVLGGILVAGKAAGSSGGTEVVLQALGVAGVGVIWSYLRNSRSDTPDATRPGHRVRR